MNTFFSKNQKEWDSAVIYSGTYQTDNYFEKRYTTKSGLAKGLLMGTLLFTHAENVEKKEIINLNN
jgi:hypothetical protein